MAAVVEVRLTAVRDQAEPARRKVNNDGEELNRVNGFRTSSGVQKGDRLCWWSSRLAAIRKVRLTAVRDQVEPARQKVNNDREESNRVIGFCASGWGTKGEKRLTTQY